MLASLELGVHRTALGEKATLGHLDIDGVYECVTLEDVVRDLKADGSGKDFGNTAIPAGRYRTILDFSEKFQKVMIHLIGVPFFTGIRMHSGNDDHDTLGCILVGQQVVNSDYIHGGSVALPLIQAKIKKATEEGRECWTTVTDEFGEAV